MKDMIERYVYAVTRRLPEKMRDDVSGELKTNIYDMLPESPADSEIEAVLESLGHPRDMAMKFQMEDRYLISPRYFADYVYVLKIVVVILILIGLATGILDVIIKGTNGDVFELIGRIIGVMFESVIDGLTSAFIIVTVVFFIIERSKKDEPSSWSVKDLPELPKEDKMRISKASTVASMIFSVAISVIFIMILVSYHKSIGFYEDSVMTAPFFNADVLGIYVPIFLVLLGLSISVHIMKLVDGQWTKRVIWTYTVDQVLSVIAVIAFFMNPNLIDPQFFQAFASVLEVEISGVQEGFQIGLKAFVWMVTIITAIDLGVTWTKSIRYERRTKPAV
ncbi:MAG: hypothetical protein K9K93_02135 [Acholeplasmataceae bacterium]|nr:hypothetical protein [Acholeplasmataceae bacterium]